MNAKPWADPARPIEARLVSAELAIANVDTAEQRRAVMRELVEGERERVARETEEALGCVIWRPTTPLRKRRRQSER